LVFVGQVIKNKQKQLTLSCNLSSGTQDLPESASNYDAWLAPFEETEQETAIDLSYSWRKGKTAKSSFYFANKWICTWKFASVFNENETSSTCNLKLLKNLRRS